MTRDRLDCIRVLTFIHDRMIHVHGENRNADYMKAMRECIESLTPQWVPMDQPPSHIREVFVLYSDGEVDIGRHDDGWRYDPPDWHGNGAIGWCEIDWPNPPAN